MTDELPVPEPAVAPDDLIQVGVERGASDTVLVRITGEVDMATGEIMAHRLTEVLAEAVEVLMVDLTGVTFFGSTGLSVLLQVHEQSQRQRVDLRIVADQRLVVRPMEIGGLAGVFRIHPSVPDALAAAGR